MGRLHHHNTFFFLFFLSAALITSTLVQSSLIGDLSDDLSSIDFAPASTIPRKKLLDDNEIVQDQSVEEDTDEEEDGLDNDLGKEESLGDDVEEAEEKEDDEKKGKEMKGRKLINTPSMHLVVTHFNKAIIFGPTVLEFDFASNKLRHMTVSIHLLHPQITLHFLILMLLLFYLCIGPDESMVCFRRSCAGWYRRAHRRGMGRWKRSKIS